MDLTLLGVFWMLSAVIVMFFQFSITFFEKIVPEVLKAAYMFGKQKIKNNLESKSLFPVPKSWFTHFYAFGFVVHSLVFTALSLQLWKKHDLFSGNENIWRILRWPQIHLKEQNALPVVLVFVAEWIQITRRLYECLFISSFSKSTMSPIHYFYGCFLYTTFGLGLLASVDTPHLTFDFNLVKGDALFYLPAILMFLFASYYQHKAMQTFAHLRKQERGKQAKGHFIPKGHLFKLVSCPHYLCEMVIYLSLSLVFKGSNLYLNCVLAFVVVNQIGSSLMSHKWYQTSFKNYPKDRKAVIPFVL